jgi:hypothetical protein
MAPQSLAGENQDNQTIIRAFLDEAMTCLKDADPDIDEAIKQLSAARMLMAMFGSEMEDRPLKEVMNELHSGVAYINGRKFTVKDITIKVDDEHRLGAMLRGMVLKLNVCGTF